jgi:3-deoxy-manno-octulosonate cytidylyltransferase (CMP-KDO synthetase)
MQIVCVIPARMGSSRFPGKPLQPACGLPMIIHIAKRCLLSNQINKVIVATCDEEIQEVCQQYGIDSIMTSESHERCTDRVSEAIDNLGIDFQPDDFILMVQGDEILVTPDMLDTVIEDYKQNAATVTNLLSRLYSSKDHLDPNVVKVVSTPENRALYFSRAAIPSTFRDNNAVAYQQTGVIGFSRKFLREFSLLPQTPLEKVESIDMLRVLEHNLPLRVVHTQMETIAVDVPADLERAEMVLRQDQLVELYA